MIQRMEKAEGARYSHYSNDTLVIQLTFEFRSSILMTAMLTLPPTRISRELLCVSFARLLGVRNASGYVWREARDGFYRPTKYITSFGVLLNDHALPESHLYDLL